MLFSPDTTVHRTFYDKDEAFYQQTKFCAVQDGHVRHTMLVGYVQQNEQVLGQETLTSSKETHEQ